MIKKLLNIFFPPGSPHRTMIAFNMTDAQMSLMKDLIAVTNLKTQKNFLLHAMAIFNWALKESLKGRAIVSIDEDGNVCREAEAPFLVEAREGRLENAHVFFKASEQ